MSLLAQLGSYIQDPPPELAFEISEAGIAWARTLEAPQVGFQPLRPGVLQLSPVADNIQRVDEFVAEFSRLLPAANGRRRRRVSVILPDFAARVSVLDFDTLPGNPQEQAALVRFRVKKSVPFDVDEAAVSFRVQPAANQPVEVVVAVIALEIIGRYEAVFRQLNLHAGYITTSLLASLELLKPQGLTVVAKRTGGVLSVAVIDGATVRLVRTVEVPGQDAAAALGVLFPTFAYVEDEWKRRPERLLACGFGPNAETIRAACEEELGLAPEPMRSRFGMPGEHDAGLLGYLESIKES